MNGKGEKILIMTIGLALAVKTEAHSLASMIKFDHYLERNTLMGTRETEKCWALLPVLSTFYSRPAGVTSSWKATPSCPQIQPGLRLVLSFPRFLPGFFCFLLGFWL